MKKVEHQGSYFPQELVESRTVLQIWQWIDQVNRNTILLLSAQFVLKFLYHLVVKIDFELGG